MFATAAAHPGAAMEVPMMWWACLWSALASISISATITVLAVLRHVREDEATVAELPEPDPKQAAYFTEMGRQSERVAAIHLANDRPNLADSQFKAATELHRRAAQFRGDA